MTHMQNPAPLEGGHRALKLNSFSGEYENEGILIPREFQGPIALTFPILSRHWPDLDEECGQ